MNATSAACAINHLNGGMHVPLDLFRSKQTNQLQCQEATGWLDDSSTGTPPSFVLVSCLLLYIFYIWYKQPRERVKHLPTASLPSSPTFSKQPFESFLGFLGGHLTEMGHHGLEECSSKWFGASNTPIVAYYLGRTPVVLVADPDAARIVLRSSNDL